MLGDLPTARFILARLPAGARLAAVNGRDRSGRGALHHASAQGGAALVAALLAAGAASPGR